jgi:hypothetical protein
LLSQPVETLSAATERRQEVEAPSTRGGTTEGQRRSRTEQTSTD